ncbi:MAG: hypothetical protein GF320_06930 [Armatimonadia bacterium]|nr:hypothetical protein [Armatimonadia bacterium]
MGKRLQSFYDLASRAHGTAGKAKLALRTHLSVRMAGQVPDTEERVREFEAALRWIDGSEQQRHA